MCTRVHFWARYVIPAWVSTCPPGPLPLGTYYEINGSVFLTLRNIGFTDQVLEVLILQKEIFVFRV